jgi:hypothetical protein
MMYRLLWLLSGVALELDAQAQYFNNVNNELCYELYLTRDALSEFRVYMVIDKETTQPEDTVLLSRWQTIAMPERIAQAQRWNMLGRRIESERAPYITKPPRFEKPAKEVEWKRIIQPIDWNNTPWKDAKQFWCCPDRPF